PRVSDMVRPVHLLASPFCLLPDAGHRDLHSFPTRRSSDLGRRISSPSVNFFSSFCSSVLLVITPTSPWVTRQISARRWCYCQDKRSSGATPKPFGRNLPDILRFCTSQPSK